AKTAVTRRGSKFSGLVTFCASYDGAIKCTAYQENEVDYVRVEKIPWLGTGENQLLYDGPLGKDPQDTS
ncbi:hypothetical protein LCGC14_1888960, partial [marine sediment metagenome]